MMSKLSKAAMIAKEERERQACLNCKLPKCTNCFGAETIYKERKRLKRIEKREREMALNESHRNN